MDFTLRHSPAFAVARIDLDPNEAVKLESGAMMAMHPGVHMEAKMQGGLMKSLKRSVMGGESLFVTTYTAGAEGGWVDAAPRLPGDLLALPVEGTLNLTRGAWVASDAGVELDTKWGGFKNLAGGEGGFLVRATGSGQCLMSCYGALDTTELAAGEHFVLDSGHMVAFEEGVTFTTRTAASGIIQSMKSGEGLVFEFTGPGKVWTQSRNPQEMISWLTAELPFSRS